MAKNTRFVGLDVHAETIAVAVAEGRGQVRSLGTIPSRPEAVRRLLGQAGRAARLLRGRSDRLCVVLTADSDRHRVRGDRAVTGSGQAGRPCQNGSP
jgi:hypothetical protein